MKISEQHGIVNKLSYFFHIWWKMNQATNIKLLGSYFNCIFFHFISKLNTKDPYKNRFGLHMLRPSSGSQHEISGAHYLPTLNHMTPTEIHPETGYVFVCCHRCRWWLGVQRIDCWGKWWRWLGPTSKNTKQRRCIFKRQDINSWQE